MSAVCYINTIVVVILLCINVKKSLKFLVPKKEGISLKASISLKISGFPKVAF